MSNKNLRQATEMADEKKPAAVPKVQCVTCLKEIPPSEAMVPAGRDYALYFCGIHCYQEWTEKKGRNRISDSKC